MLRVILNRLKTKAKELLAEEQAGVWPGRSTIEQTFNGRLIVEKDLQYQRDLLHNFVDFKKPFDSLAYRPVAGPRKLQLRGRTGSSHLGTISELQQWSPFEESARGVLQNNSSSPSGMLTLTHPDYLIS